MLHHLAGQRSEREVWWLHGARDPAEDAFAREARDLLGRLPNTHEHIFYSAASPDGLADATAGRRTSAPSTGWAATRRRCLRLRPAGFMADMYDALGALGLDGAAIHTEVFGALDAIRPGVVGPHRVPPHRPPGTAVPDR